MSDYDSSLDAPDDYEDLVHPVAPATASKSVPIKAPSSWKKRVFDVYFKTRQKAADITSEYPNVLNYAKTVANALVESKFYESKWSLAKGGFSILAELATDHFYDISSLCNSNDGWRYLTTKSRANIGFLFRDVVENMPVQKIRLRNNTTAEHYVLNDIPIFYHQNSGTSWWLYFNSKTISSDDLLRMLIVEKFKLINSNFLFVKETNVGGNNQLTLLPIEPPVRASSKATEIRTMLEAFIADGKHRSLFLYGSPGVGKTTCAYTALSEMRYRTIVFSASNTMVSFELIRDLVEMLNVDAVIIDDFDQFSNTNRNLDVLEFFNRNVKVLIGIANSLSNFHPAILRPGRFDEPISVEQLDKECVEELLGDLSERYYKQVAAFPVAYINEFVKKAKFLNDDERDEYVKVLEERVQHSKERMKLVGGISSLL